MKLNKYITDRLNMHYKDSNTHYKHINQEMNMSERTVLGVFSKMRKQYLVEHSTDKDALLLLASLEKVGFDKIKKTCSK